MVESIFVVESDASSCRLARQSLEKAGYSVHTFSTAAVIDEVQECRPALMVIAADLPGSGVALCRRIRSNYLLASTPIILLITSDEDIRQHSALETGADECLLKPFSPLELVERTQAALQRSVRSLPIEPAVADPVDIVINRAAMKVLVRGSEVATTTLEFRLVDYLARHRGHVLTRDLLLDAVWGETQFVTPRSVDACIRRVREKIEPDKARPTYLKTVRGVGYRFDAFAAWPDWGENCTCVACTPPNGRAAQAGSLKRRRAAS